MGLQDDIFNELKNDKYFLEKDLDDIISGKISFPTYRTKIEKLKSNIKEIALIATAISILEIYVKDDTNTTNTD